MTGTVDVAVVGGGPAGIAAAVAAARAGCRVALLDEGAAPGGQIWRQGPGGTPTRTARRWLERLARSGATMHIGASVVDVRCPAGSGPFTLVAEHGGRGVELHAARLVLATGARERFLPFPGWTLPGVFGVGGAQALLTAGMPVAGRRAVVAGSGPLLLPVAAALTRAGARVAVVAEQAELARVAGFAASLWRSPGLLTRAARYRAAFLTTPYVADSWVTAAEGDGRVERVTISWRGRARTVPCDLLCVGHGLLPATELPRLAGCEVRGGAVVVGAAQESSVPGILCAGEPTGIGGVELALVEGEIAGLAAAGDAVRAERLHPRRDRLRALAARMEHAFAPRAELRGLATDHTIVCRCEDVTLGALRGHRSARQARIHTRAGMGACQGRVCGTALHQLLGWEPDNVKPPVQPALVSTLLVGDNASSAPPDQTTPHRGAT